LRQNPVVILKTSMTTLGAEVYRFDLFEVWVETGVLTRKGNRVRIQDLPFRMLLVLLETPGRVVSREELRNRLWSQQTFGELDNSLHVAATKLRETLGDQASAPRYIRTIPRHGYQFIGKVEIGTAPVLLPAQPRNVDLAAEAPVPIPDASLVFAETPPVHARRPRWITGWQAGVAAAALLAASVAGLLWYHAAHRPLIGAQDKIALGRFANDTGDPKFTNALSLPFRVKFEESPYLSVISEGEFRKAVKDPSSASLSSELTACASLNVPVLITGSIAGNAAPYQLTVSAWHCSNGKPAAVEKIAVNSQADTLSALDQATEKMRLRLGEPRETLQKFNVPLMQATTTSLAALNAFTLGEEKHLQGQDADAASSYKLAVDLDPNFALAYARMGIAYSNMGEGSLSRQYYQKAFDLRDRTTDRERLYIAASYYSYATKDFAHSVEAFQLWISMYPRDVTPLNNLATQYVIFGEPEKAIPLARKATQLQPELQVPYGVLALALRSTGSWSELNRLCMDPARIQTSILLFHLSCYLGAYAQNDPATMLRERTWARGKFQESAMLGGEAAILMAEGRLKEAQQEFARARDSAVDHNLGEYAAMIGINDVALNVELGLTVGVRRETLEVIRLAPDSAQVHSSVALMLARMGDLEGAQREAEEARTEAPQDMLQNAAYLPVVRAAILMRQHKPEAALETLDALRDYDFYPTMGLVPGYYRGLVYLELHRWQQAAQEFRQVLDHSAIDPSSLYVVLSRLELGRALQQMKDRDGASKIYQQLDQQWRNADADFPPLKELHAYEHELARK